MMKALQHLNLRQWTAILIGTFSLILIIEFFVTRNVVHQLQYAALRIDLARNLETKLAALHVSMINTSDGSHVGQVTEAEEIISLLENGGRVPGTAQMVTPPPALAQITLQWVRRKWIQYAKEAESAVNNGTSIARSPLTEGIFENLQKAVYQLVDDLEKDFSKKTQTLQWMLLVLLVINLLLLALVYPLFQQQIVRPMELIAKNTGLQLKTEIPLKSEIGAVADAINTTIENLKDASDFVGAIGEGNLDIDYKKELDADYQEGKSRLTDSLLLMQARLKELQEEEKKRQWTNEGLAKFVEILRETHQDIESLGDKILTTLVKYTGSNQGALYLVNDEDAAHHHLELASLFAFDIKKYQQRKILPGEGLLGQTYLEKQTTYLAELPDDYVRITSGLGDAAPDVVLMVPLKADEQVYGVIELASFKAYAPHEISFVEKLGESIASTLANAKVGQRNRNLIAQFQEQTEVMRSQEEEMRQNMEELQATQEEISRKEKGYLEQITSLEQAVAQAKLNRSGNGNIAQLEKQIEELQKKNAMDWESIEVLDKTLRMNIEAHRVYEESRKAGG